VKHHFSNFFSKQKEAGLEEWKYGSLEDGSLEMPGRVLGFML
jgi:hypothetical protein